MVFFLQRPLVTPPNTPVLGLSSFDPLNWGKADMDSAMDSAMIRVKFPIYFILEHVETPEDEEPLPMITCSSASTPPSPTSSVSSESSRSTTPTTASSDSSDYLTVSSPMPGVESYPRPPPNSPAMLQQQTKAVHAKSLYSAMNDLAMHIEERRPVQQREMRDCVDQSRSSLRGLGY
ncbi:hypothetical protein SISNIDRAFT_499477 [Sistotremastrum niveocremeum HHB9708]|uniref:Uncharacterized protein n=1 Tax=Sistotremastrum niveocremeum HHB9708 TaxID=1314777 RepID=A0A165AFA2_9AGAM|nr:hypothetical protein SISNIDRAFT_499477 [Sistotremastrum niveocremeum HHB9708]